MPGRDGVPGWVGMKWCTWCWTVCLSLAVASKPQVAKMEESKTLQGMVLKDLCFLKNYKNNSGKNNILDLRRCGQAFLFKLFGWARWVSDTTFVTGAWQKALSGRVPTLFSLVKLKHFTAFYSQIVCLQGFLGFRCLNWPSRSLANPFLGQTPQPPASLPLF